MNRFILSLVVMVFFSGLAKSQEMIIDKWLVSGTPSVTEPLFISGPGVDGEEYL